MARPPCRDPRDLRGMSISQLESLAQDIRQVILGTCLKNGGHLGASLGTVELAIALHFVFESPRDALVWDIGHQAYAHKLLTGRWERFETIRMEGGLSGFLSREESEHDVFGAGHSSTALSAALGIAWSAQESHKKAENTPWTVAIVGDGGLTAGLAFEALNNVRETPLGPFLVVINDNQMSISRNSGAVSAILAGGQAKEYFELFGFDYFGRVNGHDLPSLIATLTHIRDQSNGRPIVLHAMTQKGKGYAPAEELPSTYHGIGPVQEKAPGKRSVVPQKSYSEACGAVLCRLAESHPELVAITAAMREGTGLASFAEEFPSRFFDVGIAEPHAVTFAAGLATRGWRPAVCIYSTFLQRALDSVIHDVVLQRLPVTFLIDRAGVVGTDGPTHHGAFDLVYLGMIPELRVSAPSCLGDLHILIEESLSHPGPWAIRYPRGGGPDELAVPLVKGVRCHRKAPDPKVIVVALGTAAVRAEAAVRELDPGERVDLISTVHAKPVPQAILEHLRAHTEANLLIVEDGVTRGGFGEAVFSRVAAERRWQGRVEFAGYGDHFIPHGSPASQEEAEGVSKAALLKRIQELLR